MNPSSATLVIWGISRLMNSWSVKFVIWWIRTLPISLSDTTFILCLSYPIRFPRKNEKNIVLSSSARAYQIFSTNSRDKFRADYAEVRVRMAWMRWNLRAKLNSRPIPTTMRIRQVPKSGWVFWRLVISNNSLVVSKDMKVSDNFLLFEKCSFEKLNHNSSKCRYESYCLRALFTETMIISWIPSLRDECTPCCRIRSQRMLVWVGIKFIA